ncbi:MAG: FtsX-like permease family protein [Phycisphaerales bacterium]
MSGRRSRTLLLIAAVALSSALIAAVACAMASLDRAILQRAKLILGSADVRIHHPSGATFPASVVDTASQWPEVQTVVPRMRDSLALRSTRSRREEAVLVFGIRPALETRVRAMPFIEGRQIQNPSEIVLDEKAVTALDARLGDELEVVRFGDPILLKVVGIIKAPPLGAIIQREETFIRLEDLWSITGKPGRLTDVDLILHKGHDPVEVAARRRTAAPASGAGAAATILQKFLPGAPAPGAPAPKATPVASGDADGPALPPGLLVQATERITSGIERNMQSNKIGLILASVLSFIAASFIIMTGLTTAVGERIRELAILRCIGAARPQLAGAQIVVGAIIGLTGAALGAPIGVAAAYALVRIFPDQLPGGFELSWLGVGLSILASVLSGLAGAVWPAVQAARTSPLAGLGHRSLPPRRRWVWVCVAAGPLLAAVHAATLLLPPTGDAVFWSYVTLGLPALMTGYFLLSVPLMVLVAWTASGAISRLLGLPPRILARTVLATPFRHGFTAGAMMLGLALHVAIWTNGHAVMRDWLDALALPDAFIYGTDLKPEARDRVAALPEVAVTCAITRMTVGLDDANRIGVVGLAKFNTYFFGFEPEPFFRMTRVVWEEGDEREAVRRLNQGGAVIVERSFKVSRGIGVGDFISITHDGRSHRFEVVGVISSPGLDIASKFMEVGEQFVENAVNSVFGSRDDMVRLFGNEAVNFIQIEFRRGEGGVRDLTGSGPSGLLGTSRGMPPDEAMRRARDAAGPGVLLAVLASEMKDRMREVVGATLLVITFVAIGAMLIACFGVANLIVAGIQARQFEFGVLRAVGASRGILARLVLGEALLIALTACILGTAMGLQGAWGGMQIYRVIIGLVLRFGITPTPIAIGCVAVALITLGAAGPAIWRLMGQHPRELLAAVRG